MSVLQTIPFQGNKLGLLTALTAAILVTTGCQSLKANSGTNQPSSTVQGQSVQQPQKLESFNITGKIN